MFRRNEMGHGAWGRRPFQKGDLKYVIMGLIAQKPRHGYEVIRSLEERSHGFYAPSPGAVYPTLQFLEEAGYVSASEQEGKRIYAITEEGRRFLDERREFTEGIRRHMGDLWGGEGRAELYDTMLEFRRLARLMHHQHWGRRADGQKMRRVRGVLSHAREEIEAILEE